MRRKTQKPQSPFSKLEAATGTLGKERKFFEALLQEKPVALVVNRVIHVVTLFEDAERSIPQYLQRHSGRLFPSESASVAATLTTLLSGITQSARLAGYLCVKGIPGQALVVLRSGVEQIGVYTHVWSEPTKYRFVPDSDSKEFSKAFRYASDEALNKSLKKLDVKFRFMHCKSAKLLSNLYSVLSASFVHGRGGAEAEVKSVGLSCEFVDRSDPKEMAEQYRLVQAVMAALYLEVLLSIPGEDLVDDELAALSIASALLLPVLMSPPGDEDPRLKQSTSGLIDALRNLRTDGSTS